MARGLLFKLMRTDPSFHIVEELGPEICPEGGYQLLDLRSPALGTLDIDFLVYFVEDFKFVGALFAPVLI